MRRIVAIASACLLPLGGCSPSQQTAAIQVGVTLAQIAAAQNKTAAQLLAAGALVCGDASSVAGQLIVGTAVAIATADGVPLSVTNQAAADVAAACPPGLVPGPAPAAQPTLPVATAPTTTLPAAS